MALTHSRKSLILRLAGYHKPLFRALEYPFSAAC